MPEGHTIFRLAADQTESIGNQSLHITSPQGRFEDGAELLDGRRLKEIRSVGKHLFYEFAGRGGLPTVLHVHLGLFGKFRTHKNPPPEPRGLVRVRFEGKKFTVDLNGPNQCELVTDEVYQAIRDRLGADPLNVDADSAEAWKRIHKSRAPIGLLLMDQSVIAGIGNIYRTEILHLAKIHPRTPGTAISRRQFNRIWKLAVDLLAMGAKHNRIITVDLKKLKRNPTKVPRGQLLRIFKKTNCPECGGGIERFVQAGRKVYACPVCQPEAECTLAALVAKVPLTRSLIN